MKKNGTFVFAPANTGCLTCDRIEPYLLLTYMVSRGYQWKDISFQAHHQKQAGILLSSYSDLVTVASQKEDLHGNGLVELGQGCC